MHPIICCTWIQPVLITPQQIPIEGEGSFGHSSPARGPSPRGSAATARGPSPAGSLGAASSAGAAGSEGTGNDWLEDDWDSSDDGGDVEARARVGAAREGGVQQNRDFEAPPPLISRREAPPDSGGASKSASPSVPDNAHLVCLDGDGVSDESSNWDSEEASDAETPPRPRIRAQSKPQQPNATALSQTSPPKASVATGFSDMRLRDDHDEPSQPHQGGQHAAFVDEDWDDDDE